MKSIKYKTKNNQQR